jgi:hypothetical protein
MRCAVLAFSLAVAVSQQPQSSAAGFDHAHAAWTEILKAHVVGNRFDYAALKKDRAALDRYLAALHAVTKAEHDAWSREQRFAFWIDAYNAHVVDLVVREYPLDSIRDAGSLFTSVWKKRFIAMPAFDPEGKGRPLSLDDVEHKILRPSFADARVHAAINCASVSCPPLRAEAFVAERLDAQLDEQARAWLADPSRNRYDRARSRLEVSAIFDWFRDDFLRDAGGMREWITRYAPPHEAEWIRGAGKALEIRFLDYSWKLNDVEREK